MSRRRKGLLTILIQSSIRSAREAERNQKRAIAAQKRYEAARHRESVKTERFVAKVARETAKSERLAAAAAKAAQRQQLKDEKTEQQRKQDLLKKYSIFHIRLSLLPVDDADAG